MSVPALELTGLTKSFGHAKIIRGIDLSIGKAERHAIIGPNGAGKSTLFNLITARFAPTKGTVKLHGEDVIGLQPYQINRKGLSRSFQITNIFPAMTVFENVRCALLWSQGYKYSFWNLVNNSRRLTEGADAILDQINLLERRNLPAGTLSYAEQRALEIGAEALLLAKSGVDGVYSADPKKDPKATKYDTITYDEVLSKSLAVADAAAFALCRENKLPIVIFDLMENGNIGRAVRGEVIGTLVA